MTATGTTWWEAHADETWARQVGGLDALTRVAVRKHVAEARYSSVVDFGCGLAVDADAFRRLGVDFVGVEQCERFRKQAKCPVFESFSAIPDAFADLVYCRHVVEHLPELAPALREMCRAARHEVLIVAGETPGTVDRLSYDASRDLFWNVWGTARYAAVLRDVPGVVNWHWAPQLSFQGRGGRDESILYVRLQR